MLRILKRLSWSGVLALSLVVGAGFSYIGPNNEAYQLPELGYNPNGNLTFANSLPIAPKDLGEEYRRNTPVLYYACNQQFLEYFGSNGLAAIDAAVAVFNGLTNVSAYSADLSEIPLESTAQNYRATALGLTDLKSTTMGMLIEQMGLTNPERYTWTLHSRWRFPGNPPPCPDGMGYYVIKRNFELTPSALDQFQSSSYVNGVFFSYSILEYCDANNSPAPPLLADAVEFSVDPVERGFSPVAAATPAIRQESRLGVLLTTFDSSLPIGSFFTGLTRDDVAGLRSLMRSNNINVESAGPNVTIAATNLNTFQLLFTSNLTQLVLQSATNTAAGLLALYPGLVISSSTPVFTNVVTTNVFSFFINEPFSVPGSPTLVQATEVTTNVATWFAHTVDNIRIGPYFTNGPINLLSWPWAYTNGVYTNGVVTLQTTTVGPRPTGTPGQVYTNISMRTYATNLITGEYVILPANSDCGVFVVRTQLSSVTKQTNLVQVATNAPGATNTVGSSFQQEIVYYFTNHVYVINPVPCAPDSPALRQGIERVRFVRRDYDSLIGQFYEPITNQYRLVTVTNSQLRPQTVIRQVVQPDILFTVTDLTSVNTDGGPYSDYNRNISLNQANALAGLAGPGTIEPTTVLTFNKLAPFWFNASQGGGTSPFLDKDTALTQLIWASFDATTNAPVVYPNGTSLQNLENQILIQVSPGALPAGSVGVVYPATTFTATGGSGPYTWSLTPGSPNLPPGLTLTTGGVLSGTPTEAGTFDIMVRLTEGGMRTVDWAYEIKILP